MPLLLARHQILNSHWGQLCNAGAGGSSGGINPTTVRASVVKANVCLTATGESSSWQEAPWSGSSLRSQRDLA